MGANPLRVYPQRACEYPSSLYQTQEKWRAKNVLAPRTVLAQTAGWQPSVHGSPRIL